MKLLFQNSRGEERVIAEPSNREEVNKEINKFLDDHNFKVIIQEFGKRMVDWYLMLDHIQNSFF